MTLGSYDVVVVGAGMLGASAARHLVDGGCGVALVGEVDEASQKATWCAVATVADGEPRVRMVHPTWEGETLWFATGATSPKVRQMQANAIVDIPGPQRIADLSKPFVKKGNDAIGV